ASRVLLVSDAGNAEAGHVERAEAALAAAGLAVALCLDVDENPDTRTVERVAAAARDAAPDLFVGLGGGSPIDAAKGADFLLVNGGAMEDYRGHHTARTPLLPLVAVPTTAGTGTEVQSFALIERASDHQKMACGDPSAAPRIALLDPELTRTQPARVTACTGLDTITHAVESFVTRVGTPISSLWAREAFARADRAFPIVLERPDDLDARGSMLLAATFAGLAIENSMLGAAHALANPLTAHHRIAHGHAVGAMLPHVVRFNAAAPEVAERYAALARAAGLAPSADALVERLREHLSRAGLGGGIAAVGVTEAAVPALAIEASAQWTAGFNPRPVAAADLERLYRSALSDGE
ncbi:MAG: iron-containing alcohol dehydrogenase, partial [Planctomycetota bacterium JB042]